MNLNPAVIKANVRAALEEDLNTGDVSAALLAPTLIVEAEIISREAMVLCGQPWVNAVFSEISSAISIHWYAEEGSWLAEPTVLCSIKGPAAAILSGERSALNFLQTLAATATQTREYLEELKGTKTRLLDTRKTIPGLRVAQKYAVACAGAVNHRMGLYDAFLIKENHIKAHGSIAAAIQAARAAGRDLLLEIEVENLEELREALLAKPDRILLDNFSLTALKEAVALNQQGCELEASGGIDLKNIKRVAETGVDYISVGAITKSIRAIDLSLLIRDFK